MVSAAVAALLATTGLASAQGAGQAAPKDSPTAASPKTDAAGTMNAPPVKGAETPPSGAGSKELTPQHAQGKPDAKTTGEMKADGRSKASEAIAPATTSKDMKSPTTETTSRPTNKTASEKADSKTNSSDSAASSKASTSPTAETKPSSSDNRTTGNAATSATAAPPAEKRTQITSAMKQEKVDEVTNVNFNISIGTAVPAGVRYHPMPTRIVEIYPEWRGYDFILVHGKYIVLRPRTHEIVYIIED
ncbi:MULTISPECIES: DUF1236 domain-containing protein [unclassified Bradyrhizobium]|uniref:DUF1236 domain-containing protein n=1 Tax=unclassified Bradyrhizobium TaxID=2631580 RepID=UPI002916FDC4|nr:MULTISPECIES: DUF1236 domain-containing protein [unclassified Bradyrhizobium]